MADRNPRFLLAVTALAALLAIPPEAGAQRTRGTTQTSVNRGGGGANRSANANANRNTNVNANRNTNINANRNTNVNVDRDINVDVDDDWDNDWDNDWDDHPVARGVAFGTAAAVTAAAIGSIAYSVPPSCVPVAVNGLTYQQCGGTWYQPQYAGSQVTYVVVNPPQ
jgi:hypothetical protein